MKKISVCLFVVILLFTGCGKNAANRDTVKTSFDKSVLKTKKYIENRILEKTKLHEEVVQDKTFFANTNTFLYTDKNFDNKNAKKIPAKSAIHIANPVFEQKDAISIGGDKDNPYSSYKITLNRLSALKKKKNILELRLPSLEGKSLFEFSVYHSNLIKVDSEFKTKTKKLEFLEELIKNGKERKLKYYRVDSIDGKKISGFVKRTQVLKDLSSFITTTYKDVTYKEIPKHIYENNPPVKVKGIYVKLPILENEKEVDKLIKLANETEINAFVIDVKDDNGYMLFKTKVGEKYMPEINAKAVFDTPKNLIEKLKKNKIYAIARVVCFKDASYATRYKERALSYKNSGKLFTLENQIWASAFDKNLWEYNIGIGEEAIDAGFNEVQFDYVRFPATSKAEDKNIDFKNKENISKVLAIHRFLKLARERISAKEAYVTADVFGWMTTAIDDQNIGQHWESLVNVVDYAAPMLYPSHYGKGNYGLSVPDAQPYKCIDAAIKDAINRNKNLRSVAKLRPWIQDFTADWVPGHINYGVREIKAQIKALKDNGIDEYMVWNAKAKYTKDAYK